MKHPEPEALAGWLYNELPLRDAAGIRRHVQECPLCQSRVENWRGAMAWLDADRGALTSDRGARGGRRGRAAALFAAAALVAAAFMAGRRSGVTAGELERRLAEARLEWESERRQADQETVETVARRAAAASAEQAMGAFAVFTAEARAAARRDREIALKAIDASNDQRAADYAELLGAVRDLARGARAGFQQTELGLNLLASQIPAAGFETNTVSHP